MWRAGLSALLCFTFCTFLSYLDASPTEAPRRYNDKTFNSCFVTANDTADRHSSFLGLLDSKVEYRRCRRVESEEPVLNCHKTFSYSSTMVTNFFGQDYKVARKHASEYLETLLYLCKASTYKQQLVNAIDIEAFFCALYFAPCSVRFLLPCQELCETIFAQCGAVFKSMNYRPPRLNCTIFPKLRTSTTSSPSESSTSTTLQSTRTSTEEQKESTLVTTTVEEMSSSSPISLSTSTSPSSTIVSTSTSLSTTTVSTSTSPSTTSVSTSTSHSSTTVSTSTSPSTTSVSTSTSPSTTGISTSTSTSPNPTSLLTSSFSQSLAASLPEYDGVETTDSSVRPLTESPSTSTQQTSVTEDDRSPTSTLNLLPGDSELEVPLKPSDYSGEVSTDMAASEEAQVAENVTQNNNKDILIETTKKPRLDDHDQAQAQQKPAPGVRQGSPVLNEAVRDPMKTPEKATEKYRSSKDTIAQVNGGSVIKAAGGLFCAIFVPVFIMTVDLYRLVL